MNKTGIGTTVDEGVFLDAALPLGVDLNSIGIVKAYLLGFVRVLRKDHQGNKLRFATT